MLISDYRFEVVRSPNLIGVAGDGRPATRFGAGHRRDGRALDEIVRLDRRWFGAHPQSQHRCRWPDTSELDLYDGNRGARLVMAIRHLGRGRVVYQPVIFEGVLPAHEGSAAALFALAASYPEPIPMVAEMDVLRLAGSRQEAQNHETGKPCAKFHTEFMKKY